jgi:phytoene desaturase
LDIENSRVKAVITDKGERISCDVVVMNPDLPVVWRDLLGKTPRKIKSLRYSPSCVTLLVGSSKKYDHIAHHNIHFGNSWDGVFDELIKKKILMTDPSVLVTVPTHDDPTLAPPGKHSYYVLFPTPNLDADIDWRTMAQPYRNSMIKTLEERGYTGFGESIEIESMTTPLDWQAQGMERGAPLASVPISVAHVSADAAANAPANAASSGAPKRSERSIASVASPSPSAFMAAVSSLASARHATRRPRSKCSS